MAKDPSKDARSRTLKQVAAAGYLTEIADGSVTLEMLEHIQTNSFLGRHSAGTGDVERLSAGNARNILNVENGATNTNDPLADANQTMTASRTIDDGDNGYSFFVDLNAGGGDTCQFLLNPAAPSATWKAQSAGTDSVTLLNTGVRLNLLFAGSADLALDSDAGAAGECITSTGSGSAPVYQGFPIISSATAPTNTSLFWYDTSTDVNELFVYDTTRSKWLGVNSWCVDYGRNDTIGSGVGHWAKLSGNRESNINPGAENAFRVPYDCTVVGWSWSTSANTTGWTHRVGKYDDSAGTGSGALYSHAPSGSYDDFTELDLDLDFDQGDLVGLSAISGTASIVKQNYSLVIRRRTS